MVNLTNVQKPAGVDVTSPKGHVAMGEHVMSDKFEMSTGQAHEFALACARNGLTNEQVKKMSSGNFLATILPILLGTGVIQIVKHLINLLVAPFPKEWKESNGWAIDEHDTGAGELEWDPSKVNLHLSKEQSDGKSMTGHALRKELKDKKIPVLNACVLEFLLAHPFLIPESWKTAGAIFFWGTIYRGPDGRLFVRYLCWLGGAWDWRGRWLDVVLDGQVPAAVLASVTQP